MSGAIPGSRGMPFPAQELRGQFPALQRAVDFAFFDFHQLFKERKSQIERVEDLSDAYHLQFRDEDVMVAYLLEITPTSTRREAESLWHDPTA